jgi:hypothetical protein
VGVVLITVIRRKTRKRQKWVTYCNAWWMIDLYRCWICIWIQEFRKGRGTCILAIWDAKSGFVLTLTCKFVTKMAQEPSPSIDIGNSVTYVVFGRYWKLTQCSFFNVEYWTWAHFRRWTLRPMKYIPRVIFQQLCWSFSFNLWLLQHVEIWLCCILKPVTEFLAVCQLEVALCYSNASTCQNLIYFQIVHISRIEIRSKIISILFNRIQAFHFSNHMHFWCVVSCTL